VSNRGLWWSRISNRAATRLSEAHDLSLDSRLIFHAMGAANAAGHAFFAQGVEASLERVHRRTGQLAPYGERHVREVIRKLIDAGALSRHSTRRCLVLTDGLWSTGAMPPPRKPCAVHGHQMRWTPRGWSDVANEARLRDGHLTAA
jgi:hypothetical protein